MARARRYATAYLDLHYETESAERDKIFTALLAAERQINTLPTKYRMQPGQDDDLMTLLCRAHAARDAHM
ncbi:integral membrane protein [Mycobacterium tuberculosis]|nr:integral membrane protein [Mycobacterium tuberculosis]COZ72978.1 integral membrane protein [Mycobacterium tuberculosis]